MNKDYLFLENIYMLLESGYSDEEILNLCKEIHHHPSIDFLLKELQSGQSLSSLLLKISLPSLFKEYYRFYQNKNCLSEAIKKSLDICILRDHYKKTLKSKLTYPAILLCFLFLFSLFVVFFLMPQVLEMFTSFQIKTSLFMRILLFCFQYIPLCILVFISLFIFSLFKLKQGLKQKKHKVIEFYLKLPFFRIFLQKYFSLKFSIYYQELIEEDLDCSSIIHLLNNLLNETDLKIVLYEIDQRIHNGESLKTVLKSIDYFDELFITFFEIFIENIDKKNALKQYIDITFQQFELRISQFIQYLIPAIYGFVALFVISVYISIVIPMMNIINDI